MKNKIAAVVVTYNRPVQLIDCIKAILKQSRLPERVYIIDNNSEEETCEALFAAGFISELPDISSEKNQQMETTVAAESGQSVPVHYVRMANNEGGAGGFYRGMKSAFDDGFDWLWMMDDDGVPDAGQLHELEKHASQTGMQVLNALVTAINDPSSLAFELDGKHKVSELPQEPLLKGIVAAFNGTFISRKVIEAVGFIKKEMFIWGDETEYVNRIRKNNFEIGTVTAAIHRHPMMKGKKERVFPFSDKYKIVTKPKHFSHFYYRNLGFNTSNYGGEKAAKVTYLLYTCYFLLRGQIPELRKFHRYFNDGKMNNYEN